jgi:hypothetical protein
MQILFLIMRTKTLLAAAAAVVIAGLIVWQVAGAVHRTFALPIGVAQVAKSTPAYQHGLTLLDIQNVSPDQSYSYADRNQQSLGNSTQGIEADTGLWIKMPSNFSLPPNCEGSTYNNNCSASLTATAHLNDGLTIPLCWRTTNNQNTDDEVVLLVSIPAGYPDTVRWADVTVDDHRGDQATWRILHLPPMQHVLGPGTVAQTTFQSGAIQANARAYVGKDPNGNNKGQTLLCDIKGTIKPSPHQWEFGPMTLTHEWEAPGFIARSGSTSYGTGAVDGVTHFEANRDPIYYDRTRSLSAYLQDTHCVRLTAKLQEFEARDEKVIFHNLALIKTKQGNKFFVSSQPQSQITRDGITVTLIDPRPDKDANNTFMTDATAVMVRLTSAVPGSLPKSPLWQKFQGVVSLSCDIPKPLSNYGSIGNATGSIYMLHSDKPWPKVIANFPVIVRQRVNLKAVPMNFVLPVEKWDLSPSEPNPEGLQNLTPA